MLVDTKTMLSVTEVNQNFSKASKIVDKYGRLMILKNNKPAYIMTKFQDDGMSFATTEDILETGNQIMDEFNDAFIELAK